MGAMIKATIHILAPTTTINAGYDFIDWSDLSRWDKQLSRLPGG